MCQLQAAVCLNKAQKYALTNQVDALMFLRNHEASSRIAMSSWNLRPSEQQKIVMFCALNAHDNDPNVIMGIPDRALEQTAHQLY